MAVNKGEIGIYGILRRDGGDGVLAKTDLIRDDDLLKTQKELNLDAVKGAETAAIHIADTNNPHSVTKALVELGNVTNDALVKRSEMGVANGVATLDANGLVLSSQLPSYVDDVLEYSSLTSFPTLGETGKIYIATDTNLTYRWSGAAYVEISKSLALGETSSTAYAGDKGKSVADSLSSHISNTSNPHNVTKALLGLGNVDNTADSSKSVASAAKLTTTHTINGVSFDGSKDVTGNFTSGLKEAYLEWGGKDRVDNSPIDACLYDHGRANRLAFGNPAGITIEYSRDGGTTWVDYGLSDEGKQTIFSTESNLVIGKSSANLFATADCMLRATLESTAFGLYTALRKFLIYVTTNGSSGCYCRIEGATSDNPTEFKVITTNDNIQGWTGTNTLNTYFIFGSGTGQIKYLRFIFGCTAHTNTTYYGLCINRIYGYGGEGWLTPSTMASTGRLYKIGSSQKASFPATVSATSFQVNNEEYAEAVTDTEITTMLNDLGI